MKKTVLLMALIGLTIGVTSNNSMQAAAGDKVNVCHVDPDELEVPNPHVIEVSASAVAGHLAHGDYLTALPKGSPCPLTAPE